MPSFTVRNNEVGNRLDKVLSSRFKTSSRVFWQKQITCRDVLVNGESKEPRYAIKLNDIVTYNLPHKSYQLPATSYQLPPLDILFENDDVIVINKPAGLITHPAHANTADSVVHRILEYDQSIAKVVYDESKEISLMRPGIVHRLDKDTSGVMIIAKTKMAMTFLAKQIQNHNAQKTYTALLLGHLEQDDYTVHAWLGRDLGDRRKMSVTTPEKSCLPAVKGRESETIFHISKLLTNNKGDKVTLVDAKPITGRTHQIRVHASHIGHPVLGDQMYGTHESELLSQRLGIKRQLLHASELKIRLPKTLKFSTFNAPLPTDFKKLLDHFKGTV